jgi:chloramphenicol 3-O-phosphotransferase
MSLDKFLRMLPSDYLSNGSKQINAREAMFNVVSGMHHAIPALVTTGNNVIVDHVLQERKWLKECVSLLADFRVLFVSLAVHLKNSNEEKKKEVIEKSCSCSWHL